VNLQLIDQHFGGGAHVVLGAHVGLLDSRGARRHLNGAIPSGGPVSGSITVRISAFTLFPARRREATMAA
jgi:hypothetical protein